VLDNASTHKTPVVKRWLTNHPRFVLHFTPTSSSWLNLVERWFSELTTKKLRRGTHTSVRQLNADIRAWIDTWNDNPRSYVWTKTAHPRGGRGPCLWASSRPRLHHPTAPCTPSVPRVRGRHRMAQASRTPEPLRSARAWAAHFLTSGLASIPFS